MSTLSPLRTVTKKGFSLARRGLPTGPFWDKILIFFSAWNALGYKPNIDAPRSFNEHILSEKKLFSKNIDLARRLTDKVLLKDWLKENGYENLVVPTLGVHSNVRQLLGVIMEGGSVVKPTHLSGEVLLIHTSRTLTSDEVLAANRWLKTDYYRRSREPTYANVMPRIIHESMLLDNEGKVPRDYKVFCFHGRPFMIQVDGDRFSDHKQQLYSIGWKLCDFGLKYPRHPIPLLRPDGLEDALDIASRISRDFAFCRVDLYILPEGEIKIGEMTFFPHSGEGQFCPADADFRLGDEMNQLESR